MNVYLDANMNGVPDGAPVGTAVTGANGIYRVDGLAAGNYLVRYDSTTAPGHYPTTAASQTVYGLLRASNTFMLTSAYSPPRPIPPASATRSGLTRNENGIVDSGETPIVNVDVRLYADLNNNGIVDDGEPLFVPPPALTPMAITCSAV